MPHKDIRFAAEEISSDLLKNAEYAVKTFAATIRDELESTAARRRGYYASSFSIQNPDKRRVYTSKGRVPGAVSAQGKELAAFNPSGPPAIDGLRVVSTSRFSGAQEKQSGQGHEAVIRGTSNASRIINARIRRQRGTLR